MLKCFHAAFTAVVLMTGLLANSAVRAEVRLVPLGQGQVKAHVSPTASGIWDVVRARSGGDVLNPQGDSWGDSLPQLSQSSDEVAAAWFRHATGEVLVAVGTRDGWSAPRALAIGRPVGMPRILGAGQGRLVAWQERDEESDELRVFAAYVDDAALAEPTEVARGQLLQAWSRANAVYFLVAEAQQGGGYEIVAYVSPDPPIIPIGVRRVSAELQLASPLSAPLESGISQHRHRGEDVRVVYWWTSPTELSVLELDDESGEPLLPVRSFEDAKGRNASPALLEEALRDLR